MTETPPARILIVDDEAPQMKALCDTLRDEGYETTGFTSPRRALDALREQRFDLVLTDLMMPEIDGLTLLRDALRIDRDLVAIMMTGHGTLDTAVEAMKLGAFDYVQKPFKLSVMRPALTRALAVRQLRVQNAELLRNLSDRTAQLEATNKELEAFSYSAAHDLRAPLRAVNGFTTILVEDFAPGWPAEAQRLLTKVVSSATNMGRLIDDLLRFSRISRQALTPRSVDIGEIVKVVLQELREGNAERRVDVTVGTLPEALGDQALIRQVFVNLMSNAFKFTKNRDPGVIEVGCIQQGREHVYFVRDNGAGFDMQYAEKLFGVFQRMHRNEDFDGTGVGLSIVQRIVHRHGGRIWAEARVDAGAKFSFTLSGEGTGGSAAPDHRASNPP